MEKQILFYVVLLLGSIGTRADLIRLTSGAGKEFVAGNKFKYFLGLLAGVAFTSIVVWGFLELKWYVALLSFIGISLGSGLLVTRGAAKSVLTVKPILDVLTITFATLIWIS